MKVKFYLKTSGRWPDAFDTPEPQSREHSPRPSLAETQRPSRASASILLHQKEIKAPDLLLSGTFSQKHL